MFSQPLGVIPILIGPLQALLALLPAILVAIGGMIASALKPSAMKIGLRVLWKNKIPLVVTVAVIAGTVYGWKLLSARMGWGIADVGAESGEWLAFRGGMDRRGAGNLAAGDPVTGGRVMTFDDDKTFYSSPSLAAGSVFVSSADKGVFKDRGAIYRLDASTLAVQWKAEPPGYRATFSSPSIWGDYVVCGEGLHFTEDARIFCFDAKTGKALWSVRTTSHVESSPCIADGRAYVGAGNDGFYCLAVEPRPDKNQVLWHLDGKDYPDCEASPAVADGRVYFCLGMGGMAVVACDAATGKELWRAPTPYPVFGNPTVVEGKVVVGMGNGNFIETAEVVRNKEMGRLKEKGATPEEMAEADRHLIKVEGEIWCFDAATGDVLWTQKLGRTVLGAIAHAGGRLYAGSCDGMVTCLDLSGKVVKTWNSREPVKTSPCVGKDHVYVVTEGGRLYGLDRATLRPVWDVRVGSSQLFLSSPVVGEGHIYVGTAGEGLACLGLPQTAAREDFWAGSLGGPGSGGWADQTPPPAQGRFAWSFPEESGEGDKAIDRVLAPVAVSGTNIYVSLSGATNGVARLVLGQGRQRAASLRWRYKTANEVCISAAVKGDQVMFVDGRPGNRGRALTAVSSATGNICWKWDVETEATGLFALGSGLLIADRTNRVSCLTFDSGAVKSVWSAPVNGSVGVPCDAGGVVILVSADSSALAVSGIDGTLLWRSRLPSLPRTGAVVAEGCVAVGTVAGITVLDLANGRELRSMACGPVAAPLVCAASRVFATTEGGEVVACDWAGKELTRISGTTPGIGPTVAGDVMLCMMPDSIRSVDLLTGKSEMWLARTGWMGAPTAPAVLSDGYLFFGAADIGLACVGPR